MKYISNKSGFNVNIIRACISILNVLNIAKAADTYYNMSAAKI